MDAVHQRHGGLVQRVSPRHNQRRPGPHGDSRSLPTSTHHRLSPPKDTQISAVHPRDQTPRNYLSIGVTHNPVRLSHPRTVRLNLRIFQVLELFLECQRMLSQIFLNQELRTLLNLRTLPAQLRVFQIRDQQTHDAAHPLSRG